MTQRPDLNLTWDEALTAGRAAGEAADRLARDKELTREELAAEYWRMKTRGADLRTNYYRKGSQPEDEWMIRKADKLHQFAKTLQRMATEPAHYDYNEQEI